MTVDYTQFDAETPLPGQYISPTWQRDEDEQDVAEHLAHAFVAAVVVAKAWDWSGLSKKWSERGYRDDDLHPLRQRFVATFKKAAGNALIRATGLGRTQALADFEVEFGRKDWDNIASTWASVYGNEMAGQVADQSHKALKDAIPQLINMGMRNDPLAQTVKRLYGLDPRSMTSALNFMRTEKKPRNQTILDLAEQLLTRRATVIGDVQAFTGLNFGRQLTYLEAQDSGLMPKSARKVWVTALDERVCKICKPMDGVSVPLMDTFSIRTSSGVIKLLVPPVHPNCRCTVVPEERYRHGIITRTARFRDEGQAHRGRLRSEVEDLVSIGKEAKVEKFDPLQPRDDQGRFIDWDYTAARKEPPKTALGRVHPTLERAADNVLPFRSAFRPIYQGGIYLTPLQDPARYASAALEGSRAANEVRRSGLVDLEQMIRSSSMHDPLTQPALPTAHYAGFSSFMNEISSLPVASQRKMVAERMKHDAEFKRFAISARKYTGSFKFVAAVRNHVEKPGGKYDPEVTRFVRVMRNAQPINHPIYRGVTFHSNTPLLKQLLTPGATFKAAPQSWTGEERTAFGYTRIAARGVKEPVRLILHCENAKGVNITPLANPVQHAVQTEFISGGYFRVKSVRRTGNRYNVDIEQIAAMGDRKPKAKDVEKFFKPSEIRDRGGRWTKGGGLSTGAKLGIGVGAYVGATALAGLATPEGRAVYRTLPLAMRELRDMRVTNSLAGEAITGEGADGLRSIFEGFSHGGLTAKVNLVQHGTRKGSVNVEGVIKHKGSTVGNFTRIFYSDGTVSHHFFGIDDQYQGTGFGSAFVVHSMDQYRRIGMKRVTVHANIDVGGYTWASMGFKFAHPRLEANLLERLADPAKATEREERDYVDFARLSAGEILHALREPPTITAPSKLNDDEIAELKALRREVLRGNVTPQDIIKVGIDRPFRNHDGHKSWAGKELMLNSDWQGVFTL